MKTFKVGDLVRVISIDNEGGEGEKRGPGFVEDMQIWMDNQDILTVIEDSSTTARSLWVRVHNEYNADTGD